MFARLDDAQQGALDSVRTEGWADSSAGQDLVRASAWALFGNRALARTALETHARLHPHVPETPLALANLALANLALLVRRRPAPLHSPS